MCGTCGRTEMRLQRDVAEILQREDAELVRVSEDRRHGHWHFRHEASDVRKGKLLDVECRRVDGQYLRGRITKQDANVSPVRGIAGERHDFGALCCQA